MIKQKNKPGAWLRNAALASTLALATAGLYAQGTSVKWQLAPGTTNSAEYFRDVAVDGEGNMYMVGSFQGTVNFTLSSGSGYSLVSAGGYDIIIAKYNRAGGLLWVERGGGGHDDFGNSIAVHTDANGVVDNIFTTGAADGNITFTGSADLIMQSLAALAPGNALDIYTSIHTTAGVCVNLRYDGGPTTDQGQGIAVQQTTASSYNVIGGGYIENAAAFPPCGPMGTLGRDGYVCRYTYSSGTLTASPPYVLATSGSDQVTNTGIHPNGDVYAVGAYEGTLSLGASSVPTSLANSGLADAFVVRMNSTASFVQNGNRLSSTGQDYGLSLTFDRNNNIYVCGYYSATTTATTLDAGMSLGVSYGTRDYWVGRLSVTGTGIAFGALQKGGTVNDDRAYDIIADNCGDRILVAGMIGTGYGNMLYSSTGATVILPSISTSKLNGMLLQLDHDLLNPVALQTYGATPSASPLSSLHEAVYGIGMNNVGDIGLAGVTSGTDVPGSSAVVISTSPSFSTNTASTNSSTAINNYNFYAASIDMSQWPVSATYSSASCYSRATGIAMKECIVYDGGDYSTLSGPSTVTIAGTALSLANQDAYLARYDLYGNPVAAVRVTTTTLPNRHGLTGDICTAVPNTGRVYSCGSVNTDATGVCTIAGINSPLVTAAGVSHLFLAAYDDAPGGPALAPAWRIYDQNGTGSSAATDVCTSANGDIFVIGSYSSAMTLIHFGAPVPIPAPATTNHMFIMKVNPAGTIQWFNGNVAAFDCYAYGITTIFANSTPIVCGQRFNGLDMDIFIASFNPTTGALLTNYSPASSPFEQGAAEICANESGDAFAITGAMFGTQTFGATPMLNASGGGSNVLVAMYNLTTTSWLWSRDEGDIATNNGGRDLSIADDHIVVTGHYTNNALFNGAALASAGGYDIFWARYDALTGNMMNAVNTAGGPADEDAFGVVNLDGELTAADGRGNCAVSCGAISSAVVSFGGLPVTNTGFGNHFVAKINSQSSVFSQRLPGEEEESSSAVSLQDVLSATVMPNPFSSMATIRIEGGEIPENTVVRLYDLGGRLVQEPVEVSRNEANLDGSALENGIYIYTIMAGDTPLFTGKLLVQH